MLTVLATYPRGARTGAGEGARKGGGREQERYHTDVADQVADVKLCSFQASTVRTL